MGPRGRRWPLAAAWAALLVALLGQGTVAALSLLANADSYSVRHGHTLNVAAPGVLANDVILLGSSTAVRDSNPSHGALTLQASGAFTYTPVAGYVGIDSFQYHVHDGLLNTLPATVTINVTNATPVARDDAYAATTGVSLTVAASGILANDTDADGDSLTAQLVDGGGNGSLDVNADGSFTFKSGGSFSGDRTFTYRVSDGLAWSSIATATITVSPLATPTPGPTPTPAPTPTPTPAPTATPALPPLPTSLPLPSGIVAPSLPPLPSLVPLPTSVPSSLPLPTSTAQPTPTPGPSSPDLVIAVPPVNEDAGGLGPGPGGTAAGAGNRLDVDDEPPFGTFDGLGAIVLSGFDWAVPGLALSVPGLLLILAVAAQGGVGLFSLPFVRRWLGNFGLWRRRGREARTG